MVFSPYVSRPHLHFYEGTVAKACQIRGAQVEYLLCDGLLPECDQHWDSFLGGDYPRPHDLCVQCQAGARAHLSSLEIRFSWLGEYISENERVHAVAWAQSVQLENFGDAMFHDRPIGDWVRSSVISYFRRYPVDLSSWRVACVYRGFLLSGAFVVVGLSNYLKGKNVSAAVLFNGRQSITRVAFEILRCCGIRVMTREMPFYQNGHLNVKPNARCWTLEPFCELWESWKAVPLSRSQLTQTFEWLQNRRYAIDHVWYPFNKPLIDRHEPIRQQLGLNPNKRIMALFTSSTDETAGDPELMGPFESQSEWVKQVVDWVLLRSDVELVIRVHPHLAGKTGFGKAVEECEFYQKLAAGRPENVRVVMPDVPLNSYALMDEADIGLTFGSTVGIEMAMLGKPVLLASRGFYEVGSLIATVRTQSELNHALEKTLGEYSPREIRREAYRMAHCYVFIFEPPFPLVSKQGVFDVRLNYKGVEALGAGCDPTLDRILDLFDKWYFSLSPAF